MTRRTTQPKIKGFIYLEGRWMDPKFVNIQHITEVVDAGGATYLRTTRNVVDPSDGSGLWDEYRIDMPLDEVMALIAEAQV